jgi:hypothetical protein
VVSYLLAVLLDADYFEALARGAGVGLNAEGRVRLGAFVRLVVWFGWFGWGDDGTLVRLDLTGPALLCSSPSFRSPTPIQGLAAHTLDRLDISLEDRLSNLAFETGGTNRLVWLEHGFDAADESFHVRLLAMNEEFNVKSRTHRDCDICLEKDQPVVIINPCMHELCEGCYARHAQRMLQQGSPISCPFCKQPVAGAARLDDAFVQLQPAHFLHGGSITLNFISVTSRICETLAWAAKAKAAAHRPPNPVALVKLSIQEPDGTLGTAVSFLQDGLALERVVLTEKVMGASLNERRTPDGRFQCMFIHCMKMEEAGGFKFLRCSACHIVRFCSRECQKKAWNQVENHKRMCGKYSKHVAACKAKREGTAGTK